MTSEKHSRDWMIFIYLVIVVNSAVIYAQVSGYSSVWLNILDTVCTLIFLIEMIAKISAPCFGGKDMGENDGAQGGTFARLRAGWNRYWHNGWNTRDSCLAVTGDHAGSKHEHHVFCRPQHTHDTATAQDAALLPFPPIPG